MPATRPDHLQPKRIEIEADWNIVALDPPPPRLVLAAVVGESPAVVTETLWALFNRTPTEHPERVVIFTTTAGRKRMCDVYDDQTKVPRDCRRLPLSALGSGHKAWEDDDLILALCRLCREWNRPVPIVDIHVPRDERNEEIQDIRTEADDRAFGNLIFREIRELTKAEGVAVHASVAGGRKTMGTRLASVLSMFGRPQDELSHVLVTNSDYENPGYWCPSKQPGKILVKPPGESRKSVVVDDPSVVQLVRQRFWPLRGLIDEPVLKGEQEVDLDELELAVQAMLNPPPISFHDASHTIIVGSPAAPDAQRTFHIKLNLQPVQYAFYRTLAAAKEGNIAAASEIGSPPRQGYLQALDFVAQGFGRHTTLADGSLRPFAPAGSYFLSLAANARATLAGHAEVPEGEVAKKEERIRKIYLGPLIKHLNESIREQIGYSRIADRLSIITVPYDDETLVWWSVGLL